MYLFHSPEGSTKIQLSDCLRHSLVHLMLCVLLNRTFVILRNARPSRFDHAGYRDLRPGLRFYYRAALQRT